ncbi:MAG: hypothetical protein ACLFNJ_05960 [Bacteroidales bacterium]
MFQYHFGTTTEDFYPDNISSLEEKLSSSFEHFPDELGQLCISGAELAENAGQRSRAQTFYLLAWDALQYAEHETQTFRFDRMVEINAVRDKLALMGINVGKN